MNAEADESLSVCVKIVSAEATYVCYDVKEIGAISIEGQDVFGKIGRIVFDTVFNGKEATAEQRPFAQTVASWH